MLVVGICGDKQHGKDTVAQGLVSLAQEYGVKSIQQAMANPLKEEIAECFAPRMNVTKWELVRQMNTTGTKERWRLLMQWWGTEYRRADNKDYWVDRMRAWLDMHNPYRFVTISDIRFQNEISLVQHFNGYLIRVNRPGFPTDDAHASEQEWKQFTGWNQVIENDGTEEELKVKIATLYTLLEGRGQF